MSFGTDQATQVSIVEALQNLMRHGVEAFRFERQVPATRDYPKGVASTQWMNLTSYSKRQLTHLVGSMLTPGVDFVRRFMILEEDIPKLPTQLRKAVLSAMKK